MSRKIHPYYSMSTLIVLSTPSLQMEKQNKEENIQLVCINLGEIQILNLNMFYKMCTLVYQIEHCFLSVWLKICLD